MPPSEALAEPITAPQVAEAPPADTSEDRDARPTLRDKFLTAIAEKAERVRREQMARSAAEVEGADHPAPEPPAEAAEAPEAPPEQAAEGEGDATPGQPPAAETAAPAEPASPSPPPAAPARRPVEINGVTYQLSDDELLHYAKIGAITSVAMRQQPQAQPQALPEPSRPAPAPKVAAIDRERARSVVRSLAYGNEEEGAEALEKLVNELTAQPAEPPVTPYQIAEHAAALATQKVRLQQDLATIGAEFPDVFADLNRTRVATLALQDIVQRDFLFGNTRPDIDRMREAAQTVRASLTMPASAPRPAGNGVSAALQAAPAASPEADKLARKRAAPKTPTGTGHTAPAPEGRRPSTPAEIIMQMRKDRGQAVMR